MFCQQLLQIMRSFIVFKEKAIGYEIYIKGYIYQLIACLIRNNFISFQSAFKEDDKNCKGNSIN
jgi:hypothetical protein